MDGSFVGRVVMEGYVRSNAVVVAVSANTSAIF